MVFTCQGFRKISVDEIAHLARVSKATIYQIFGDKVGLLGEVYKRKASELKEKMNRTVVPREAVIPQLLNMLNFAREFYSWRLAGVRHPGDSFERVFPKIDIKE